MPTTPPPVTRPAPTAAITTVAELTDGELARLGIRHTPEIAERDSDPTYLDRAGFPLHGSDQVPPIGLTHEGRPR